MLPARGVAQVAGIDSRPGPTVSRRPTARHREAWCLESHSGQARSLTPEERRAVEHHPLYTWEILSHVTAFAELAAVASPHHEKLDRSGYPWGLKVSQLDFPCRILVVADMFEALTADRPYRAGMSREAALDIMVRDRDARLCPSALDALAAHSAALVVEL